MIKSAVIRARVEPKLKAQAEKYLADIGLSPSDAIRIFYNQIVIRKGLPLDLRGRQEQEKTK